MIAEILSIGTELLLGQIVDTNAAYLAQRLAELGIAVYFRDTVGDNHGRLQDTLRQARERADLIICTGGLGPTQDDITAECIAAVFDAPLEVREEARAHIAGFFAKLGRPMTEKQIKQAMLPVGSHMLDNPNGTAPGFLLEKDGKIVIAMPGPPNEMEPMWRDAVAPHLARLSGATIVSRTLRFCGIGEGDLETRLEPIINAQTNPTVAPYAKVGEVHIRVTARAATAAEAETLIAPVEAEIRATVGEFIYGVDDETLEAVVGNLLRAHKLTVGVAESCTGGLLGGRLTNVAGSSDYFMGGVIAYKNSVKQVLLLVPRETLLEHGAVSEETARAMADGACAASGAQIGISITGIAGPGGGSAEKPVGLVYIGLAAPGVPAHAVRYEFWGNRASIRQRAVQQALVLLRNLLIDKGEMITWKPNTRHY
jgi:nicotinamide-nucleotide amidase